MTLRTPKEQALINEAMQLLAEAAKRSSEGNEYTVNGSSGFVTIESEEVHQK